MRRALATWPSASFTTRWCFRACSGRRCPDTFRPWPDSTRGVGGAGPLPRAGCAAPTSPSVLQRPADVRGARRELIRKPRQQREPRRLGARRALHELDPALHVLPGEAEPRPEGQLVGFGSELGGRRVQLARALVLALGRQLVG